MFCFAGGSPVIARGGHGMGGFGMRGGHRMGEAGSEGLLTPAYVLITVSKVTDAEAFKVTMRDLVTADTPFAGRLSWLRGRSLSAMPWWCGRSPP